MLRGMVCGICAPGTFATANRCARFEDIADREKSSLRFLRRFSSLACRGHTGTVRVNHLAAVPSLETCEAQHHKTPDEIGGIDGHLAAMPDEPSPCCQNDEARRE